MRTTELESKLGADSFSYLVDNFAGKRIYIPPKVDEEHPLNKLPKQVLNELISNFSKLLINVPKKNINQRNQKIIKEFYQGKTYTQLAIENSLTERWVMEIISRNIKNNKNC